MWGQLVGVLILLVAFGNKIAGWTMAVVLALLNHGGFLSNIALDEYTTLSIRAQTVVFSVWRCLWAFARSPTKEMLIAIEVPVIQLVIRVSEHRSHVDTAKKHVAQSTGTDPSFWATLDTRKSLKDIEHPVWVPARVWFHRIRFIYYLIHVVGFTIGEINVNVVVQRKDDRCTTPVRVKHASMSIRGSYNPHSSEALFSVNIAQTNSMRIELPGIGGIIDLQNIELKTWIPVVPCDTDNPRSPLPASCSVSCGSIAATVDFAAVLKEAIKTKSVETVHIAKEYEKDATACDDVLVLFRLVQSLPDEITIQFFRIDVIILRGSSEDAIQGTLLRLKCRVFDPQHQRLASPLSFLTNELSDERKIIVDIEEVKLVTSCQTPKPSISYIRLDALKVNAEWKMTIVQEGIMTSNAFEDSTMSQRASCITRISGESKKLAVQITDDLALWVISVWEAFDQAIDRCSPFTGAEFDKDPVEEEILFGTSILDVIDIEMQIQIKLLHNEILAVARDTQCCVLPEGVPDLGLQVDEVNILVHPFLSNEPLGIRAKTDIQAARLKMFYFRQTALVKTPFLTLEFVRVFIEPISLMTTNNVPADVEMDAEWLELRWSPDALHSIGGLLDLGICVCAPLLTENPLWENDEFWDPLVRKNVPQLESIRSVSEDIISVSEAIKFRCTVKKSLALFCHTLDDRAHADFLTVDSIQMSVEESTGRFRITVSDTKVQHCNRDANQTGYGGYGNSKRINPRARTCIRGIRLKSLHAHDSVSDSSSENKKYLSVKTFSLEENRLPSCPKTVVDMFVDGVECEWDISTQRRITELVRQISFATWEMLYRIRSSYAINCTSASSRYNRPGGVNVSLCDIDEFLRCEKLLPKIISASGDKLHRMRATNIDFRAKFCSVPEIRLVVGLFGGDDLPDLWIFENITMSYNDMKLLSVDHIHVRHTRDKLRDYVFGEFEELYRLRQVACLKIKDGLRSDGIMVDVEGVHVVLNTQLNLMEFSKSIQIECAPHLSAIATTLSASWRPQHDVFFQFFLRVPQTPGKMKMWLELKNTRLDYPDNPMEGWLERMYPLWRDELEDQELRALAMEEQAATFNLSHSDSLQDTVLNTMNERILERQARIYVQKVKHLQAKFRHNGRDFRGGSLVSLSIGCVSADLAFESSQSRSTLSIRKLDEATPAIDAILRNLNIDPSVWIPHFDFLADQTIVLAVQDICIRIRGASTPLVICDHLECEGNAIITGSTNESSGNVPFHFTGSLRCFLNMNVAIKQPVICFSPGYIYTLNELATMVKRYLPLLILDVDRAHQSTLWDILRRCIHAKASIRIQDATARLILSSSSFESGDHLEIGIQTIVVEHGHGSTDIQIDHLIAKIQPDALLNIAEVSSIHLETHTTWSTNGDPRMHYTYPVAFRHASGAGDDQVTIDLQQRKIQTKGVPQRRHNPLAAYAATGYSLMVSGKVAPIQTNRMEGLHWAKRDLATRTSIILDANYVEWLARFTRIYSQIPMVPFPWRLHEPVSGPPTPSLLTIFEGIQVTQFDVMGLDFALYHSEKCRVGIRACINETIGFSGSLFNSAYEGTRQTRDVNRTKGSTTPKYFVLDMTGGPWLLANVLLHIQDTQVRMCTSKTGSRGEPFVSVRDLWVNIGGDLERICVHATVASSTTECPSSVVQEKLALNVDCTPVLTADSRVRSKKSILEHFSIPQYNPYRYRDNDTEQEGNDDAVSDQIAASNALHLEFAEEFRSHGFIAGIVFSEVRVLVTLDTIETMIDMIEIWSSVFRACCPELSQSCKTVELSQDAVVAPNVCSATNGLDADEPPKITSLTQDPKFGAIFRASTNATSRTNSIDAAVVSSMKSAKPTDPVVDPFLLVRFMDCQLNIQDHQHKGSVLLVLNSGSLRDSRSTNANHETIKAKVEGVQLFTAPLDIDVKSRVTWLRVQANGSYGVGANGLLEQVIAPISIEISTLIDRDPLEVFKIDVQIHRVPIEVNANMKDILHNLSTAVASVITAKREDGESSDDTSFLPAALRGSLSGRAPARSLHQLLHVKKRLKWKLSELVWRQTCRLHYYMSERSNLSLCATEDAYSLGYETEPTASLRHLRLPSMSVTSLTLNANSTGMASTHSDDEDEIQCFQEQYESVSLVVRSLLSAERKRQQPTPNVQLEFVLPEASITLSAVNASIVSAKMTSLRFKMVMRDNQSGSFALTIQDISCANLCPGTPYPELLQLSLNSMSWSGDHMFLRVDAEITPPVGGITVVQHFEVNVHPMQVCLTQDLILQLITFFSPSPKSTRQDEKRAEVRSQFLVAKQEGGSSSERLLKKAAKVAGRATNPHSYGLGRSRANKADEAGASARIRSAVHALSGDAAEWIERVTRPELEAMTNRTRGSEGDETDTSERGSSMDDKDSDQAASRDTNIIVFKRIRMGTIDVVVTYKNKKYSHHHKPQQHVHQALEDMRGVEVKIHSLVYCDKTCSVTDLMLRIRRDIILDVLSQVGRNFSNIANFLRDQFDISRLAPFDSLAPLKNLTSTFAATASVVPAALPPHAAAPSSFISSSLSSSSSSSLPSSAQPAPSLMSEQHIHHQAHDLASPPMVSTTGSNRGFQLELPENHPSLRKRKDFIKSNLRVAVPTSPNGVATSPRSGDTQDTADKRDTMPTSGVTSPSGTAHHTTRTPKSVLTNLFSKKKSSKKAAVTTIPSPPPPSDALNPPTAAVSPR